MSRFIYPENPQVTYWREKCEALQATLEQEREQANTLLLESKESERRYLMDLLEEARRKNDEQSMMLKEYREDIEVFNSLPWYEKLLFKFD